MYGGRLRKPLRGFSVGVLGVDDTLSESGLSLAVDLACATFDRWLSDNASLDVPGVKSAGGGARDDLDADTWS